MRFGNPESHAAPRRTAVPPGPVPAILAALGGMGLDPAFRATMEERIARKLILSPDHLKRLVDSSKLADSAQRAAPSDRHAALAGAHDLKAGAMDYQGKIRLVRLAMKSPLDRLEVRWVPAGETSRLVSLRPVSLEKTGTGYTLEAEDLATGSPLRIGIGAMSSVRLVRASYFGETK